MERPCCPRCGRHIPATDTHTEADLALCRSCGGVWSGREAELAVPGPEVWGEMPTPRGCSVEERAGLRVVVVSVRALGGALIGAVVAAFWFGVLGFMAWTVGRLLWSGIARQAAWSGAFWAAIGVSVLFALIPGVLTVLGVHLLAGVVMRLGGRYEVDGGDGGVRVRAVVGPFRRVWRRAGASGVEVSTHRSSRGGSLSYAVTVRGDRPVTLSVDRPVAELRWIAGAIRHSVFAETIVPASEFAAARCPACGAAVRTADIDVAGDLARCASCGEAVGVAGLVRGEEELAADLPDAMPGGCRVKEDAGVVTVTASMASFKGFLAALVLNGFWNGLVSVFAGAGYGALYRHLVGPLPSWYPWANSAVSQNHGPSSTANTMPLGEAVTLCLVMVPFMLVGSLLFVFLVLTAVGRVRVTLRGAEGEAFRGVVAFGRGLGVRRGFDASRVRAVKLEGEGSGKIVLVENGAIKFGGLLPRGRARWMAGVLRGLLVGG